MGWHLRCGQNRGDGLYRWPGNLQDRCEDINAKGGLLGRPVKLVYYDLSWIDKSIQVTEEEKTILENLEIVARRKYESNLTPQQDVIKAQVEITKLINELLILRRNRKTLEAKITKVQ